jgi:hypothetical protein
LRASPFIPKPFDRCDAGFASSPAYYYTGNIDATILSG